MQHCQGKQRSREDFNGVGLHLCSDSRQATAGLGGTKGWFTQPVVKHITKLFRSGHCGPWPPLVVSCARQAPCTCRLAWSRREDGPLYSKKAMADSTLDGKNPVAASLTLRAGEPLITSAWVPLRQKLFRTL